MNQRTVLGAGVSRLLPAPGPGRTIAAAAGVASVGFGLYAAASAAYFVEVAGLSVPQVGLGLSAAALVSYALGIPIGHLADRVGPREVALGILTLEAALLLAATQVRSFPGFLLVVVPLGVAGAGANVARSALITGVMGRPGRVKLSAYLRSVFNVGISLGIAAAGVVIGLRSHTAYQALLVGNATTSLVVACLYLRLPRVPGRPPAAKGAGTPALRDLPYLAVAQVSGLIGICEKILAIGLPIWVLRHTEAPRALAAWAVGVSTVLVALLQVRASRGAETLDGATRIQRWGFAALAVSCLVVAASGGPGPALATALLVLAAVLIAFGEMWLAAAGWAFRYELAPEGAQGQYGGAYQLGGLLPAALGPTLVAILTDRYEVVGWTVLAAIFLVGLVAGGPAIRWARRTRPRYLVDAPPAADPAAVR